MKTYTETEIWNQCNNNLHNGKNESDRVFILKSDFDKAKEKFKDSLALVLTDKKFRTLKEVLELAEECFESDEK